MATHAESIKPRKQRKFRYTAPMHARKKMVACHVSRELRAKLGTKRRSAPAHKGDKVKVMRGEFAGKMGKITLVDLSTLKVFVEGVVAKTAKGVEKPSPLDPSNLLLLEGDFSKDRLAMMERSPKAAQKQR